MKTPGNGSSVPAFSYTYAIVITSYSIHYTKLYEYRLMGEVINDSSARWFRITTNGVALTISGRLAANEVLVIDTANMTAKVMDTDGA